MKYNGPLTIILIMLFLGASIWLTLGVLRIQRAGEAGLPPGRLSGARLDDGVKQLIDEPSVELIQQLLPEARQQYGERGGDYERYLLSIVLYYAAALDPEQHHTYIREVLPLVFDNYRSINLAKAGSGEMLVNCLALGLREEEFLRWQRDLLSIEPYLRQELDLQALNMWIMTDRQEQVSALVDEYINREISSSSDKSMAFKIHCMLNQYDKASQYEYEILDGLDQINSSESADNDRDDLTLIDRFSYISAVEYLIHNGRFEDLAGFLDSYRSDMLDPASLSYYRALAAAAQHGPDDPQFRSNAKAVASSPYIQMSREAVEASVYADLAEAGDPPRWISAAVEMYNSSSTDSDYLCSLAFLASLTDSQEITVTDAHDSSRTISAIELAQQAIDGAVNDKQMRKCLITKAAVVAALPNATRVGSLQEQSMGYLRSVFSDDANGETAGPGTAELDLSLIADNQAIRRLRDASPAYDQAVHELLRNYVAELDSFYGPDPLGQNETE